MFFLEYSWGKVGQQMHHFIEFRILRPLNILTSINIFVMLKIDRKFGLVLSLFLKSDAMQSCYDY